MAIELLNKLQKASFKGASFLVKNSSITFGQKVAVHDYPNANRTETEFLGQSLDVFNLDIYIHGQGQDYIQQRNALKNALSSDGEGVLVHPYEGEITASAVANTLIENDRELGIARFSVTFQKVEKGIFPRQEGSNAAEIRQGSETFLGSISEALTNNVIINNTVYDDFKDKSNKLIKLFEDAKNIAAVAPDRVSEYQLVVDTFQNNVFSNIFDIASYAEDLVNVYDKILFLSDSAESNIEILSSLFSFGDDDASINNVTFNQQITIKNRQTLNDTVQGAVLALAYTNAATIDFETDVELNAIQDLLEDQYDKIIENLTPEYRFTISILRSDMKDFFDDQTVRRVIEIQVNRQSLTNITYGLYGNMDEYDRLFNLNNRLNPLSIEGDVTVLTDG